MIILHTLSDSIRIEKSETSVRLKDQIIELAKEHHLRVYETKTRLKVKGAKQNLALFLYYLSYFVDLTVL